MEMQATALRNFRDHIHVDIVDVDLVLQHRAVQSPRKGSLL